MAERARNTKQPKASGSIYAESLLTRTVSIPMVAVGTNLEQTIHEHVVAAYESKCIVEGFVKGGSTKVMTYSSGMVKSNNVLFTVVFRCDVCSPVAGMRIKCVARNITKAGIRAECVEDNPSPIVAFIIRDHHNTLASFQAIEEGDIIDVRVLGQRFELNDLQISIIGELVTTRGKG